MRGTGRFSMGRRRAAALLVAVLLGIGAGATSAETASSAIPADLAAQLTPAQARAYLAHLTAKRSFDRQLEMYWAIVEERRDHRRKKYAAHIPYVAADYVAEQPPKYLGPAAPPDVARIIASLAAAQPAPPERQLPTVRDFLEQARQQFGFVPTPVTEREFKRRYAVEALAAGLTKAQVVRVYALETGGQGTYDMQAGFDPISKQGRPISTALGYAQLLAANSISELVRHGNTFLQRLSDLAAAAGPGSPRAAELEAKIAALQKMLRQARSVPDEWRDHETMAKTVPGHGIHAINMDADIGPWLQALKLKGLLTTASEAGRGPLNGAEIELMNLAGPRTGLEMMEPVGRTMPTANFFAQGGYYRNTIVREKIGAELLAALDERMNANLVRPGAVEFAQVFDEVQGTALRGQAREPVQPFGPQSVFSTSH